MSQRWRWNGVGAPLEFFRDVRLRDSRLELLSLDGLVLLLSVRGAPEDEGLLTGHWGWRFLGDGAPWRGIRRRLRGLGPPRLCPRRLLRELDEAPLCVRRETCDGGR